MKHNRQTASFRNTKVEMIGFLVSALLAATQAVAFAAARSDTPATADSNSYVKGDTTIFEVLHQPRTYNVYRFE